MNIRIVSFVLAALTSLMIVGPSETSAQVSGSKYGGDSVKCVTNLTLYRELYKQKNYKDAIGSWRYVYNNCPRSTENILINGANMYNCFIAIQKDSAVKQKLIDTLLLIYDNRIKYYGNEGKNLANKANDLLNADSTRAFEAYGMLKRSVDLMKNATEQTTLLNYCSATLSGFRTGKISNESLVDFYTQAGSIIDYHLSSLAERADSLKWKRTRTLIDANTIPVLQCKDLVFLFTQKLTSTPDDPALLKKVTNVLYRKGCTDDSLYLTALEKLNVIEPGVNTAFLIAREYVKRKDTPKAVEILSSAADKLNDDADKAKCYYYLGVVYADAKDFANARANALKTLKFKPAYGEAFMLIADCYALTAATCGSDDISNRAAFWCAVDKLNQAKKVDSKLTAKVNVLIDQYSRYFPSREMLFSKDLKIGSKYQVGCWINETTTVRSGKEIKK